MTNKEDRPNCPEHLDGETKKGYLFKNDVVFCNANVCRYDKEVVITYFNEKVTLCKAKALLSKLELDNPDKTKKSNKLGAVHRPDPEIRTLADVRYIPIEQLQGQL